MSRRTLAWAGAGLVALALLAAVAWRFGPALALSLTLAVPAAEEWLRAGDSSMPEEIAIPAGARRLTADLYRPSRVRGAFLLVHGLSPAGRRHPELARLARLLAREDRLVLVPHFEGLAAFRLSGTEVDDIGAALAHLARLHDAPAIAGFSFGAGPAMLAAAREPRLSAVASFGGYATVRNVIVFLTTGVHTVGGRRVVQPLQEYNRWKLLSLLLAFVESPRDRDMLGAIAAARLVDPARDTGALETDLAGEGRAVMALVLNRRDDAVEALIAALPSSARAAFEALSPLAVVPGLPGRLVLAHGASDDSIPFSESLRLAAAAGGRARLAVLRTFHHTGPEGGWRAVRDGGLDAWELFGLVDTLLVTTRVP